MPRLHTCFQQHLNEAMPSRKCTGACGKKKKRCDCKRCKCREEVSFARTHQLVQSGAAEYITIRKEPVQLKQVCSMCTNDDLLKKSCSNCNKTGEIMVTVLSLVRSSDIVIVTTGSGEPGHEVFRSVMSGKTPRVATIEFAHIQRAYVNGYEEDIQRIEEYGKLGQDLLRNLIVPFRPDPWEGRTLFSFSRDERT